MHELQLSIIIFKRNDILHELITKLHVKLYKLKKNDQINKNV